jgi:hypothetical protein
MVVTGGGSGELSHSCTLNSFLSLYISTRNTDSTIISIVFLNKVSQKTWKGQDIPKYSSLQVESLKQCVSAQLIQRHNATAAIVVISEGWHTDLTVEAWNGVGGEWQNGEKSFHDMPWLLCHVLTAVTTPGRKNLRKGRLILVHSFSPSWHKEHGRTQQLTSWWPRTKERDCLYFPHLIPLGFPAFGMVRPSSMVGLPP